MLSPAFPVSCPPLVARLILAFVTYRDGQICTNSPVGGMLGRQGLTEVFVQSLHSFGVIALIIDTPFSHLLPPFLFFSSLFDSGGVGG